MTTPRFAHLAAALLLLAPIAATAAEPAFSMAKKVPASGLVFYLEYDGIDGHEAPWKATAAYAMLRKTPAGSMAADIARQLLDRLLKEAPEVKVSAADILSVNEHLMRNGFLVAVYDDQDGDLTTAVVMRGVGRKGARETFDRVGKAVVTAEGEEACKTIRHRGREIYASSTVERKAAPPAGGPVASISPNRGVSWWFDGEDLILVDGLPPNPAGPKIEIVEPRRDLLAAVLNTLDGKAADASTHPGRMAALAEGRDLPGFHPNGLVFAEAGDGSGLFQEAMHRAASLPGAAFPTLPAAKILADDLPTIPPATEKSDDMPPAVVPGKPTNELELIGLDRVKRVVGCWGFQGKALMTVFRLESPPPHRGLMTLLDQPGFATTALPPIPRGAVGFGVGSFDLAKTYDAIIGQVKVAAPDDVREIDAALKQFDQVVTAATGQRLREDLLRHFGPTWCVYAMPGASKATTDWTTLTLLVEIDDPDAVAKVLDALAVRFNAMLGDPKPANADAEPAALLLEKLPAPDRGYRLTSPAGVVAWLDDEAQPTIQLGKKYLAVALNPEAARSAIRAEARPDDRWQPSGDIAEAIAGLPPRLTSISLGNPSDSAWPDAIANLPKTAQFLAANLDPGGDAAATPADGVLSLIGIPRPGALRIRVKPANVPKPAALRALLFPSVLATSIDARGVRILCREAFPFACLSPEMKYTSNAKGNFLTPGLGLKFGNK